MDWSSIRALFPATAELAYLNTATYGPGARPVLQALEEATAAWAAGRGDWREWEAAGERARELFAGILGVAPSTVACLPALSVAAGQVAESLPARPGANLVVGAGEFRSNLFPWLAQERRGLAVRSVPFEDGRLDAERVCAAIDDDTLLVAVSSVQSANGFRADLAAIGAAAHAHGARLFVDGTQSVGALRLDLEHVDYVAVAAYKWLLAPRGVAFLHVAAEHVADMAPVCAGWRSAPDPHASYYGPPYELSADASRFDVSLAWHPWVGAAAALELVTRVGLERIEARDLHLARRFTAGLEPLGLHPLFAEAESSPIVALALPDPEAARLALAEANVVAAVRDRYLRAAFHFFNDESDVDRALAALARAVGRADRDAAG